jgi:4-amino-4-deoxy-L-arabinose transferase-like glycosyltransferase
MSRLTGRTTTGVVARPSAIYADRSTTIAAYYAKFAVAAILTVMLCQIVFLVVGCDWDLCGDEAEFWAWSRKLAWSYYARGPVIAWLIRLATELLGGISLKLTGSLMLAVRLPAVLLGGLSAWGVYRLASVTSASNRTGMIAVLLLPAIPVLAIGGVVITADTPLVCCWAWAAVWTYRAVLGNDIRAWVAAGLIGAVGILAKYSFLAFPASVGLFLVLSPPHRRKLTQPGFWVMSVCSVGLGLAPILIWNAHHGWAGAGQLADRVGLSSRANWASIWPVLSFLGGEAAALGGIWWLAGLTAIGGASMQLARRSRSPQHNETLRIDAADSANRAGLLYLLCLWGVIWTACLAASVLGETELNWMVPGYVTLVVLIGMRLDRLMMRGAAMAWVYAAGWCVCVAAIIAIHHTEWFYPAIARWIPAPTWRYAAQLRRYDPTARMRGHQVLARAVAERLAALEAQGSSPLVLTPTYGLTSTLSFYLPGQPETYCLSWNYGMTSQPVNQHDLWHPNPRHDPDAFRNRPVVVVDDANMPPSYSKHMVKKGVFGRLESLDRLVVRERGVIVGAWDIAICQDYHGVAGYKQNPLSR